MTKDNVDWEDREPQLKQFEINNFRLVPKEIKDSRGNVVEIRIEEVILERLKDINGLPIEDNVDFRVKVKPIIFVQPNSYIDQSTGMKIQGKPYAKEPLIKDLDVKFTEINKALDKALQHNKMISLSCMVREKIKISNPKTDKEIRTSYYEIFNKHVPSIDILGQQPLKKEEKV